MWTPGFYPIAEEFMLRPPRKPSRERALSPDARMRAAEGVILGAPVHAADACVDLWPSWDASVTALRRWRKAHPQPAHRGMIRVWYRLKRRNQEVAWMLYDPKRVPDPAAWLADHLGRVEIVPAPHEPES
ncbi:MAG: hypothetical protein AB7F35_18575 [Acetobacteraceae bacterium]